MVLVKEKDCCSYQERARGAPSSRAASAAQGARNEPDLHHGPPPHVASTRARASTRLAIGAKVTERVYLARWRILRRLR